MLLKKVTTSVLRNPFYDMVNKDKLLLTYASLATEQKYKIKVDYFQIAERRLLIFQPRDAKWWHNLYPGVDVKMQINKESHVGYTQIIEDVKCVAESLHSCLMRLPESASTYGVRLDKQGLPLVHDSSVIAWDLVAVYVKLYRILIPETHRAVEFAEIS